MHEILLTPKHFFTMTHMKVCRMCNAVLFYGMTSVRVHHRNVITRFYSQSKEGASADKLQAKAANILPIVAIARFKQDPMDTVVSP
jgi:hypothetical protein